MLLLTIAHRRRSTRLYCIVARAGALALAGIVGIVVPPPPPVLLRQLRGTFILFLEGRMV